MKLAETEVHLWLAQCSAIQDPVLLGRYRSLMNQDEVERQQRYRFQRDRHRDLIARALVRTTLSYYCARRAVAWQFAKGAHDKPELIDPPLPLQFNLSHSGDYVLCAVALRHKVGVDIENTRRCNDVLSIARHHFSADEYAELQTLPKAAMQDRFFEYWTLKESYMKARGEGISLGLGNFSFMLGGRQDIGIRFSTAIQDRPGDWRFWLMDPVPSYRLALAWQTGALPQANRVKLFKVVPLHQFQAMPWRPRRVGVGSGGQAGERD